MAKNQNHKKKIPIAQKEVRTPARFPVAENFVHFQWMENELKSAALTLRLLSEGFLLPRSLGQRTLGHLCGLGMLKLGRFVINQYIISLYLVSYCSCQLWGLVDRVVLQQGRRRVTTSSALPGQFSRYCDALCYLSHPSVLQKQSRSGRPRAWPGR